jgi:hypothetical protein
VASANRMSIFCSPSSCRRSLLRTLVAVAACFGATEAGWTNAQSLVVSGGAVQSNSTPVTYDQIEVSGTDGSGNRSTYTATAPVTLTGTSSTLLIHEFGLVRANATLAASGYADISASGTLEVNGGVSFADGLYAYDLGSLAIGSSGSVTTGFLYLSGTGAFSRSAGGVFSASTLSTADGATVNLTAGDTLSGDVLVDTGAVLDLQASATIPGTLYLAGGGALSRTTATVSSAGLSVAGQTSFQAIAGDAFDTAAVTGGASLSNSGALTLNTVTVSGDDGAGNASVFTVGGALTIPAGGSALVNNGGQLILSAPVVGSGDATISVSGSGSVLRVSSAVTAFGTVSADTGGQIDLASGSLSASTLALSGTGSFSRTSGNYGLTALQLSDGAEASFTPSDSISESVVVGTGSTLTLLDNLALSQNLTLTGGGLMSRTVQGITAPTVEVAGATSLALIAGDSIATLSLATGGQVSSATVLTLTTLLIDDQSSLLTLLAFGGTVDGAMGQLHYGLRLDGDAQALLSSYVAAGRMALASSPQPAGVLYAPQSYGNFTYVGYVAAVPEPSTLTFAAVATAIGLALRAHRRARTS